MFDHTGTIQLAVTIIGPTNYIDLSRDGATLDRLITFTKALSSDLGHIEDA